MSTSFVKLCGLSTRAAVDAAVAAGADALGFVFAESPRRIDPAEAAAICADVPRSVWRIAVMRRPTREQWQAVVEQFLPDFLQMEADHYPALGDLAEVRPLPVFRDTPQLDEAVVASAPLVLFEGERSGVGARADWGRAGRLARLTRLVLAGGLDPENVARAIETVRPWGVDVSSGIERAPGEKDPRLIAAFVGAAREAMQRHAD